jgi:transcriptional regulator with XRE-family HTH domain
MQMNRNTAVVPEWTLRDRLKKAREHAGLSQTELGREIGVSLASVMRYETGKTVPPRGMLIAWAFSTGVDLSWLLGGGEIIVRCSRTWNLGLAA